MSTFVGEEVSSIKPGLEEHEGKKRELKFKYSTAAFDSYVRHGFEAPDANHRPDKWELRMLSQVDPTKGPVKVRVTRMFRIRVIDYESEKQQPKEWLYYETEWRAKQWNDNPLGPTEHIVGKHKEQTKRLVMGDFDQKTGVQQQQYIKDVPKFVYTIPFTKKAVDDALENKNPFGPDSLNTTDKDNVVFYGKFENVLGIQNFRCGFYTYEQFTTPEWKQFVELALQEGGPPGREQNTFPPQMTFIK